MSSRVVNECESNGDGITNSEHNSKNNQHYKLTRSCAGRCCSMRRMTPPTWSDNPSYLQLMIGGLLRVARWALTFSWALDDRCTDERIRARADATNAHVLEREERPIRTAD